MESLSITALEQVLLKKSIDKDKIAELLDLSRAFAEAAGCEISYYPGDCAFAEIAFGEGVHVLNGNLVVDTIAEDCLDCDDSLVMVLGNMRCSVFINLAEFYIAGSLQVSDTLLCESHCNMRLRVEGNIETKNLLDFGHSVECSGKITAKNVWSFNRVEDSTGVIDTNKGGVLVNKSLGGSKNDFDLPKAIGLLRASVGKA